MPKKKVVTKFYTYSQNNSGGWFTEDMTAGIGRFVIVEAIDADDANYRAKRIGLYFEGCAAGLDCDCCGDRWSEQWSSDSGTEYPMVYGQMPDVYVMSKLGTPKSVFVHHMNGKFTIY